VQNLFEQLEEQSPEQSVNGSIADSVAIEDNSSSFKLALYLNSPCIEDIHILSSKDPLVNFRCYIVNANQKEKFMFMKKIRLREFTADNIWDNQLSLSQIFNSKNKLIVEKSLTFVVLVSFLT
jgi:hypothetical protein